MPTLHNWKALNIQTTINQVCCTLSGWNYANSKRAWNYNGNLQIVSNTQKIPAQMKARQKILSKFSYPKKSQTGKFQTLRSLDRPRNLKWGCAQRPPPPPCPHFTAKGLDTAHLCINMQPQDCSQHDWVKTESLFSVKVPDIVLTSDVTRSSPVLYREYSRWCRAQYHLFGSWSPVGDPIPNDGSTFWGFFLCRTDELDPVNKLNERKSAGGTILSEKHIFWSMKRNCSHEAEIALQLADELIVNPHTCGRGNFWIHKGKFSDSEISGYMWRGLSSILLVVVRQATNLPGFAQFFFSNTYPTYPPPRLDSSSPTDLKLTKNFSWPDRSLLF